MRPEHSLPEPPSAPTVVRRPENLESETSGAVRMSDSEYECVRALVYEHSRINLGTDKKILVVSRLAKRLRELGLKSYAAYCERLRGRDSANELGNLVDIISTNHTHFFREPKHFDFLRDTVLPRFRQKNGPRSVFRLWSAAASSGEEAYSLAMTLAEFFGVEQPDQWEILATDISLRILEKARRGIYPSEKLGQVPPDWQRRYLQRGASEWEGHSRVREVLRARVEFQHLNLLQEKYPFGGNFDVIFCRNVMIYFDRPTQQKLLEKLCERLVPGGFLMVGHSESLGGVRHNLRPILPAVFQQPD